MMDEKVSAKTDLTYRETETQTTVTEHGDDQHGIDPAAEIPRDRGMPNIDHLPLGLSGMGRPLFFPGDRIVAQRRASLLEGNPWLDTRVYIVKAIDTVSGLVYCTDEEVNCSATICYNSPTTEIRLAPAKGDPFKAPKKAKNIPVPQEGVTPSQDGKKKRGRPKGSKNRPKAVVAAERRAKKQAKAERKARRAKKNGKAGVR